MITLRTFQPAEVVEILLREGVFRSHRTADVDFRDCSAWMIEQMDLRLSSCGESAIWFWSQLAPSEARRSRRDHRGDFLLTVRVPSHRVLRSHFLDWHQVINRSLHVAPMPGESDDDWWSRAEPLIDELFDELDAMGLAWQPLMRWPAVLANETKKSWSGIFDPATWGEGPVQATTHEIRVEDLVEITRLW